MPKPKSEPKARNTPKPAPVRTGERPILYPEIDFRDCRGADALTAEGAKALLDWQEETDDVKFGPDYLLTTPEGKKVRCLNDVGNRPLKETWMRTLAQDILNKHWKFNGETVVIGQTGKVLSGQHRLIALVIAEILRTSEELAGNVKSQKGHWEEMWDGPVGIETLVVLGVDESGETTRTLDNVRPRTLADVLFADENFFGKKTAKQRERLCRWTEFAVRTIWDRTHAKENPYHPYQTHSEALDLIDRHPRLIRAVKHVAEENGDNGRLEPLLGLGYQAGLLYLMGSSLSDVDAYRAADPPTEKKLDWTRWDKAMEFFVLLAQDAAEVREVRYALAALRGEEGETTAVGPYERVAILVKAWGAFVESGRVANEDLVLHYLPDPDDPEGPGFFNDYPTVGGIDLGPVGKKEQDEEPEGDDPKDEDELKSRREAILADREKRKKAKGTNPPEPNGDGEPSPAKPRPKPKRTTRKDIETEQTREAREADEAKAAEEEGAAASV